MKILTWNINGIRANKRCLKDVLDSLESDVICLQETKITRDMLDEPSAIVEGYNAYFSFSRKRSGYSGTANFCRDGVTPTGAEEGLSGLHVSQSEGSISCVGSTAEFESDELNSLEGEGRAVMTQHEIELDDGEVKELVIINVYVPRAADREDRWTYKLRFLALLQSRAEALLQNGKHVIVLGDINTTHKRIDHCDPSTQEFLRPDSRHWIDQFLRSEDRDTELAPIDDKASFAAVLSNAKGGCFLDAFRFFHPEETEAYTNWCTVTGARQTNFGRRLDYIFINSELKDFLVDCWIMADFEGSDHCPVVLELRCKPVPSKRCPPLCTKLMPEFQGRQQKLHSFFSKSNSARPTVNAGKEASNTQPGCEGKKDEKSDVTIHGSNRDDKMGVTEKKVEKDDVTVSSLLPTLSVPVPLASSPVKEQRDLASVKSPEKTDLKRTRSVPGKISDTNANKKRKGAKNEKLPASNSGGKQASLFNFFLKPQSANTKSNASVEGSDSVERASKYFCKDKFVSEDSSPSRLHPAKVSSPEKQTRNLSLPSLTLIPSKPPPAEPCPIGLDKDSDKTSIGEGQPHDNLCEQAVTSQEETVGGDTTPGDTTPGGQGAKEAKPKASSVWKGLLSGPPPPPPCKGHREPCVLRTVKKAGPNKGKQFYVCARPEGHATNKEARCDHFQWVSFFAAKKKT